MKRARFSRSEHIGVLLLGLSCLFLMAASRAIDAANEDSSSSPGTAGVSPAPRINDAATLSSTSTSPSSTNRRITIVGDMVGDTGIHETPTTPVPQPIMCRYKGMVGEGTQYSSPVPDQLFATNLLTGSAGKPQAMMLPADEGGSCGPSDPPGPGGGTPQGCSHRDRRHRPALRSR